MVFQQLPKSARSPQADEKPEEDEDRKREDRVEERRLARVDKDQWGPMAWANAEPPAVHRENVPTNEGMGAENHLRFQTVPI